MQSWFILSHPSGPYFELTEKEFEKAVETYPELADKSIYYEREASAQIVLDGKNYFDSETFLEQMSRLMKLTQFSEVILNFLLLNLTLNRRISK
jgi:hypothetical protein